jgi:methylated-DNA-[protein]-cysteine S-methyltransferase
MPRIHRYRTVKSGLGVFAIAETAGGELRALWLDDDDAAQLNGARNDRRWNSDLVQQLRAYFNGDVINFDDVPTPDGPEFFARCWAACRRIKPGTTISYSELAMRAGSPKAVRAAGQAMRHNPLPVIVPCHRVVASTGKLHGFAGETDPDCAALRRKQRLLELERSIIV